MIRYLRRKEIDDDRWNGIISDSRHETIYPYTWYLDLVADQWSALVMQDYEYIMPVVWRRKMGIRYLYQPVSTQQLGIYTQHHSDPDPAIVRKFLRKLPSFFKLGDYAFNRGNVLGDEQGFDVEDRTNYELDLSPTYEQLQKSYSGNTRRNVARSYRTDREVTDRIGVEEFIARRRELDPLKRDDRFYETLTHLVKGLVSQERGVIYGIRNGGDLIAAALFAGSRTRTLYLHSFSDKTGKEERSMFRVVDHFIQMHAGEERILDFEGSNISSIARFFGGFGARPVIYQKIRFNRLLWGLKKRGRRG